jgi:hypothetical protein
MKSFVKIPHYLYRVSALCSIAQSLFSIAQSQILKGLKGLQNKFKCLLAETKKQLHALWQSVEAIF